MAKGDFHRAQLLLRSPLDSIQGMRDPYTKSMRVAVRSRILHALRHVEDFSSAATISLQQCRDLIEYDDSSLDKGTIRWIVDELLSCTNELVDAGILSGAMDIINNIAAVDDKIPTMLPKETRDYIQRRQETITRLRTAKRPSLSSEQILADTIHTASGLHTSEERSSQTLCSPDSLATAATAVPDVSVKTSPIWLRGHTSESSGVAQKALAKRLQTNVPAERPAKNLKAQIQVAHLSLALKTKLSPSSLRGRLLGRSDTLIESMPSIPLAPLVPLRPLTPLIPLIAEEV